MGNIKDFLKVFWDDWVAIMSGIASIALAFWAAYFPPADVAAGRTLLWITAVVCFILAAYRIWSKEHSARLKAERELADERANNRPDLLVGINQVAHAMHRGPDFPLVFVSLSIRNVGYPSAVFAYRLTVQGGGVDRTVGSTAFDGEKRIPSKGGTAIFRPEDMIYVKTVQPIPRNGVVSGWAMFALEGFDESIFREPGIKFKIVFEDALGKQYEAEWAFNNEPTQLQYVPGMPPLIKPKPEKPSTKSGRRKK